MHVYIRGECVYMCMLHIHCYSDQLVYRTEILILFALIASLYNVYIRGECMHVYIHGECMYNCMLHIHCYTYTVTVTS